MPPVGCSLVLSVCAAQTYVLVGVEFCNQQILLVDLLAVAWTQVTNIQFSTRSQ